MGLSDFVLRQIPYALLVAHLGVVVWVSQVLLPLPAEVGRGARDTSTVPTNGADASAWPYLSPIMIASLFVRGLRSHVKVS